MALDITLIIIGILLSIIGIMGSILPVLPGSFVNYIAILMLHFTSRVEFSIQFLISWAIIVIIVQALNYYVPIWGTKKFGGGKKGIKGCTIGTILGIFILPPWGIIILPFIGAVIGELADDKQFTQALKAGTGAFLGFIGGVIMNLVVAIILTFTFFKAIILSFL